MKNYYRIVITRAIVWISVYVTSTDCFNVSDGTALHAYLLNGYNRYVRPSTSVDIDLDFHLLTINQLDVRTQKLSTSGWFTVTWTDQRFDWSGTNYASIQDMYLHEDTVWLPQIVVDNTFNQITSMSGSNLLLRVTSQGHVTWEPPGLYNTHCSVDTTWFPFDVQTCTITISGWPYNVEDIRIRNNASQILTKDYHTNGEWQLYHTYISSLSTNGRNFLSFVMTLERRYEFYVMNVIVPILLTSLLTPMVFKLPSESGERISFILTVVLALEVLLTVVSTHMPATSLHTSVMEVYLVVVLTISGLAVILTALVLKLYHKGNDTELPTVIRWALRLYRQLRRGTKVKTKAQDQGMDGTDSLSSNDVTEEPIPGNNEKLTNNYMLDGFDKIDADKANKRITCRSLSLILDDVLFWLFFTLTLSCTLIFMLTMGFGGS